MIDVQWNRTKISNGARFNDVLSNNYNQLFYGYQSKQQDTKFSTEGIAKTTDNITFWNGDKDQIWKGTFDVNKYPIDYDTDRLLMKEGVVVDWYPDQYNNEFSLYKKINTFSKEIFCHFVSGKKGNWLKMKSGKRHNPSIFRHPSSGLPENAKDLVR